VNTTVAPTTTTQASLNPGHRFHPLVEIFPEMEKYTFAEFVADIKVNGVREPVTVHKNQIIDGRNRQLACDVLGITCPQRVYEGKESDLLAFVLSKNLHRRQMSASQLAMVAANIANMRQGERTDLKPSATLPKVSQAEAAKQVGGGVSERSVRDAVKVKAKAEPEIIKAVEQNKLPVSAATKIVEHPAEIQRQAAASIASGAKPADVVRALPASGGKARPNKDAVRTTCGDASDTPPIAPWVWGHLLEFDATGALSHDAAEIFAQMSRDERRDVARVAKLLIPWLQTMIGECRKVHKVAKADKIAESDRQQMPLPGIKREQDGNPLAPKTETADPMTTAQTRRRA
jgi:hypothetical protein